MFYESRIVLERWCCTNRSSFDVVSDVSFLRISWTGLFLSFHTAQLWLHRFLIL